MIIQSRTCVGMDHLVSIVSVKLKRPISLLIASIQRLNKESSIKDVMSEKQHADVPDQDAKIFIQIIANLLAATNLTNGKTQMKVWPGTPSCVIEQALQTKPTSHFLSVKKDGEKKRWLLITLLIETMSPVSEKNADIHLPIKYQVSWLFPEKTKSVSTAFS